MNEEIDIIEDDEDEYEFDPEKEMTIRAKWSFDGAKTLHEAAGMLRQFADWLEMLEAEGWQFVEPVKDDYGFAFKEEA